MNDNAVYEPKTHTTLAEKLASLLAECSEGDEGALAELYHLTAANLFALQVRILGMDTDTEQALHDTYIRIWQESSSYSEELGAPMTWLTSIARNHALNLKREARFGKEAEAFMDDTAEEDSEYADATFLGNNPAARRLKMGLEQLDINTSDAIIRAYLDGWSLEELSEAYNKPVDSLKNAIHDGVLSLRGRV